MVREFFLANVDYLLLVYGLSFVFFLSVLYAHLVRERPEIPFKLLVLFAATAALHPWLRILALSSGDAEAFLIARTAVGIVALLLLAEFGRAATAALGGARIGRWSLLALLLIASPGALDGLAGLNASMRYVVGLVGGLWAAYAFHRFSRQDANAGGWMRVCALAMGLFAVTVALGAPHAGFFPVAWLNRQEIFDALGVPVELFSTLLIFVATAVVRAQSCIVHRQEASIAPKETRCGNERKFIALLALVLVAGFAITSAVGHRADDSSRAAILRKASIAAIAVRPEEVKALAWSEADLESPVYRRVKAHLMLLRLADRQCRFISLVGLRGGETIFLADSEPAESPDYSPPGQRYTEAPPEYGAFFSRMLPMTGGPSRDRWGEWVTGYVPILGDPHSESKVVLAMDVDAGEWRASIAQHRLVPLGVIIFVVMLIMGFYLSDSRMSELLQRTQVAEVETRAIIDNIPFMAWLKGRDGHYLKVNAGFEAAVGRKAEEIIGRTDYDLWPRGVAEAYRADDLDVINNGKQRVLEEPIFFQTGKILHETFKSPVFGVNGALIGTTGIAHDITERKQAEGRLHRVNEQLERYNKALSEFTSVVSHELRAPLGTILQAVEVAMEEMGEANAKARERLIVAHRNVQRLAKLTTDVLDLTKLRIGKTPMHFEPTDLKALILDVALLMGAGAEAKGVWFKTELPDGPVRISCDGDKIRQAVINLASNATKFTPEGGTVTLRAAATESGARIEVADTGEGIPPEVIPLIFEPFQQLKSSVPQREKGSGLGLMICKQVVEAHRGRISVTSKLGAGSVFAIDLPREVTPPGTST